MTATWAALPAPAGRARFRRPTRGAVWRLAALVLGVPLAATAAVRWLRPTWTGSLPRGLYRVVAGGPRAGAIGVWCLPPATAAAAHARGYLNAGALCPHHLSPVGKIMLAVAGDTVHFDSGGVTLRGRHVPMSRPRPTDRLGRPVRPARFGTYVLGPGQAWLWSPYVEFSYDSRYFGPVGPAGFREVVVPVLTLPATPLHGP